MPCRIGGSRRLRSLWNPTVNDAGVRLLAQANRQSLGLHLTEEDAHAHEIFGVVERDVHARQPADSRTSASPSRRQRPLVGDGQVIEPLTAHHGPDVRSRRQLPPERRGAQQRACRFVREWLQLRDRGLVRCTESDRFALGAGDVGGRAPRQHLVQVHLRFDVLAFADCQLILQVFGKRRVLEALDGFRHVRRDRHVERARASLVSRPAQRQHHPCRIDPAFQEIGPPSVGRLREDRRQVGGGRLLERLQREGFQQFLILEDVIGKRGDTAHRLFDRRSDRRRAEPRFLLVAGLETHQLQTGIDDRA